MSLWFHDFTRNKIGCPIGKHSTQYVFLSACSFLWMYMLKGLHRLTVRQRAPTPESPGQGLVRSPNRGACYVTQSCHGRAHGPKFGPRGPLWVPYRPMVPVAMVLSLVPHSPSGMQELRRGPSPLGGRRSRGHSPPGCRGPP